MDYDNGPTDSVGVLKESAPAPPSPGGVMVLPPFSGGLKASLAFLSGLSSPCPCCVFVVLQEANGREAVGERGNKLTGDLHEDEAALESWLP